MDFEVERADLHRSRVVDEPPPDLEPGQVLLRVDAFGLTANNVTYAVIGEALRYWQFFPARDPGTWGRIPVWGFADVIGTSVTDVAEGTRVYGYLPMSTHLAVTPGRADERGFADVAPHRAPLPGVYNRYRRVDDDPIHDPQREDHQMLLWPLFATSFLIDDFLDDNGLLDAAAVVVSSASSRTAIGTAYQLTRRKGVQVIGLTSPGNADFVEGLGVYAGVVTYDELTSLPETNAVYVDIAGNGEVRAGVHRRLGDRLGHSMMVGATHWDQPAAPPEDLPGPPPTFFFAPDQVTKRSRDWGQAGLDDRLAAAWREFVEFADGWIRVHRGNGPDAVERAYREVLENRSDPAAGHVLSMREDPT
jgi:NADPH:quinone reductase-like Zn-dependent oxidoreductase